VRVNNTARAVTLGSASRTRIVAKNGRPRSLCGRCGTIVSERVDGKVRYCRDCVKVDPVFCGWVQQEEIA
jgi:hypothetical protein